MAIWTPVELAFTAPRLIDRIAIRGPGLAVILAMQVLVAALGIGAGLSLLGRRPGAVALAKTALLASAAIEIVTYVSPSYPHNRPPGDALLSLVAALAFYAVWFAYLSRSKRVAALYR